MLAIHLLLLSVSSRKIEFKEQKNYTKDELIEKAKEIGMDYGNIFKQLISSGCELFIQSYYPNISFYQCAYFIYVCNQLTPAMRHFTYTDKTNITLFNCVFK